MHILIIGSMVLLTGILLVIFAPLVDRFDSWLNGPVEEDEIIIPQAKVFDHATSETKYFDIELTAKSASG